MEEALNYKSNVIMKALKRSSKNCFLADNNSLKTDTKKYTSLD